MVGDPAGVGESSGRAAGKSPSPHAPTPPFLLAVSGAPPQQGWESVAGSRAWGPQRSLHPGLQLPPSEDGPAAAPLPSGPRRRWWGALCSARAPGRWEMTSQSCCLNLGATEALGHAGWQRDWLMVACQRNTSWLLKTHASLRLCSKTISEPSLPPGTCVWPGRRSLPSPPVVAAVVETAAGRRAGSLSGASPAPAECVRVPVAASAGDGAAVVVAPRAQCPSWLCMV